jgi:hypothetical protein
MKAFDETYADPDFQRQLAAARDGWMTRVPRPGRPDLDVPGLKASLLARLLAALTGGRR